MTFENVTNNIALFREMIRCGTQIDSWCFDNSGHLLETNSSHRDIFLQVMEVFGCRKAMEQHIVNGHSVPLWLNTPPGLSWMAAFYREGEDVKRIYAIGPFLSMDCSLRAIRDSIYTTNGFGLDRDRLPELEAALQTVPILTSIVTNQLGLMLHYAVTGEKLGASDILFQHEKVLLKNGKVAPRDRHRTWIAEQNMMRMIREGDLNYRDALNQAGTVSDGVQIRTGNALRQAKISVIVSISLCVRAAIQGGLTPDIAYSLGDRYIQSVEDAQTASDVAAIHSDMFDDFIQRVHRGRNDPGVSQNIRRCCDYIETHTEEELSIEQLANLVGYTNYYLSRKFKEEVQIGINDYIKIARIERAKFLLCDPDLSIQDVASRLHFCSVSHFGTVFRKLVGCSAREWRENAEKMLP